VEPHRHDAVLSPERRKALLWSWTRQIVPNVLSAIGWWQVLILDPVVNNLLLLFSGSSDELFSLALYHFNHTLVTSDLPSPALQVKEVVSRSP